MSLSVHHRFVLFRSDVHSKVLEVLVANTASLVLRYRSLNVADWVLQRPKTLDVQLKLLFQLDVIFNY